MTHRDAASTERTPDQWANKESGAAADTATALPTDGNWQGVWRTGRGRAGNQLNGQIWHQYSRGLTHV